MSESEFSHETQILLSSGKSNESQMYDVFISYSHQNSDMAHKIKDTILSFHPNWTIFIDVAELKTGVAWQVKLYKSIGNLFSAFSICIFLWPGALFVYLKALCKNFYQLVTCHEIRNL